MANVHGEIVKSGKGVNLLFNGYLYRKDHKIAERQHWRCSVRGCGGRAHTDHGLPPVIVKIIDHTHIPDEKLVASRLAKHRLCIAAKAAPLTSLSQVGLTQLC